MDKILDGTFTGFATIDVSVVANQRERFNECPPIYYHREITRDTLRSPMKEYVEKEGILKTPQRLLVSDLSAKKITLLTTYIRHLVQECSCEITFLYDATFFQLAPILRGFFGMILEKRRKAQEENNNAKANACKLKLNSIYGRFCINVSKLQFFFVFYPNATRPLLTTHRSSRAPLFPGSPPPAMSLSILGPVSLSLSLSIFPNVPLNILYNEKGESEAHNSFYVRNGRKKKNSIPSHPRRACLSAI